MLRYIVNVLSPVVVVEVEVVEVVLSGVVAVVVAVDVVVVLGVVVIGFVLVVAVTVGILVVVDVVVDSKIEEQISALLLHCRKLQSICIVCTLHSLNTKYLQGLKLFRFDKMEVNSFQILLVDGTFYL